MSTHRSQKSSEIRQRLACILTCSAASNGVAPGEQLDMIVSLASGRDYDDVIGALVAGRLRIGVRAQAFDDGESEALINTPNPFPAPGAAVLGVIGLIATGMYSRRKMTH